MHAQQRFNALDGHLPLTLLRNLPHQLLTDPVAVAAAMAPTTAMLRDFRLLTPPASSAGGLPISRFSRRR